MDEVAADFMDEWLEANVAHRHVELPSPNILAALAVQCVADAKARGISLESVEAVVGDIEEAIQDELEFVLAVKSLAPRH